MKITCACQCLLLFFLVLLLGDAAGGQKARSKRDQTILDYAFKARLIFRDVKELRNYFLREPDSGPAQFLGQSIEQRLLKNYLKISSTISSLERQMGSIGDVVIDVIIQAFPEILNLQLQLHEISSITSQINFAEEQLQQYLILGYSNNTDATEYDPTTSAPPQTRSTANPLEERTRRFVKRHGDPKWRLEEFTLQDFAMWATGHSQNSIMGLLSRLNDLVLSDQTHKGTFQLMVDISKVGKDNDCSVSATPSKLSVNPSASRGRLEPSICSCISFSLSRLASGEK